LRRGWVLSEARRLDQKMIRWWSRRRQLLQGSKHTGWDRVDLVNHNRLRQSGSVPPAAPQATPTSPSHHFLLGLCVGSHSSHGEEIRGAGEEMGKRGPGNPPCLLLPQSTAMQEG
jgi:hypothetical protein